MNPIHYFCACIKIINSTDVYSQYTAFWYKPETKATFSLRTVRTSVAFTPSFLREPAERDETENRGKIVC